jgi:ABC-type multidrug transport system, permease component
MQRIFSDTGVIVIFFVAGTFYPILYNVVYNRETLTDISVVVVDDDNSADSRRFTKKLDATPEVKVNYKCVNMIDAERLFRDKKVNGIIYFPSDYSSKLAQNEQAYISLYCDMSSFLYYSSVYMATNKVMLDEIGNIETKRYNALGMVGEQVQQLTQALPSEEVSLFLPSQGYRSATLPAMLIIIIHQTLFFGIGILSGTAFEEGKFYVPKRIGKRSIYRVVLGRSMAYFVIYVGLIAYITMLIPKLFHLPHLGNLYTLTGLMIPFLLSTIFFSITVNSFIRNRETGLVMMAPFSIILLFLSGYSWPVSCMPDFWRHFSHLFPSTFGVQGFIQVDVMGASLSQIRPILLSLWILTGVYFITACFALILNKMRVETNSNQTA